MSSIRLPKIDRDSLSTVNMGSVSSIISKGSTFPSDLSPEKSVMIHVYDTTKQEKDLVGILVI